MVQFLFDKLLEDLSDFWVGQKGHKHFESDIKRAVTIRKNDVDFVSRALSQIEEPVKIKYQTV